MGVCCQFSLKSLEPVPRVVIQKPDAGIKGRASPCFNGKKTALIDLPCEGKHVLGPEPCRNE